MDPRHGREESPSRPSQGRPEAGRQGASRHKASTAATSPPAPSPAPDAKAPAPPTVTLKQLAAQLAEAHALSRRQAEVVMADVIGLMVERLKAGDRLRIGGFGILEVKHRPARTGRNPATGAAIQIAASKTIAFRPAKEIKEVV